MSDNLPGHYDRTKMGLLPEHLDEKGNLRPLSQVLEPQLRAKRAAEIASAIAKREADAKRTPTEARLAQAQAALKDAKFSGAKDRIELWKTQVSELTELVATETAKAKRDAEFAADKRIKIIRDLAEGIKRSGPDMYVTNL